MSQPTQTHYRRWSAAEWRAALDYLDRYRHSPHRLTHLARRLGRSRSAVKQRLRAAGHLQTRAGGYLTVADIARLTGRDQTSVLHWIKDSRLPGVQAHRGVHRRRGNCHAGPPGAYQIASDTVLAWLEDPASWHSWQPDSITDPDWRAYLRELRAGWLDSNQVAARLHVHRATVQNYYRTGRLPGRQPTKRMTWFRETDVACLQQTITQTAWQPCAAH